jgi:glycosyltransferase involved in cell wall biosynthesis
MRILVLLKTWPGGVGGGVKNIIEELEKLGHEVNVIARKEDLKIYSFLKSIFTIRKIIKDKGKNYDIIYTHDWSLAFPLFFLLPIYRKKHFSMFHGYQNGIGGLLQYLVAKLLGKHLLVMAPSLKKRFPWANINYCGVDLEKFKDLKKKRKNLGWIDKGTEIINKKEIEEIGRKLNMSILIAKGLKYEEMNEKFYNKCKVFISFPPMCSGFQASWLEAMAAGVPIVIGNNNGAGEVQPFNKIPLGEEHNIQLIIEKIKNPSKKDYKKWIKENDFTWKRHADKLIEIWSEN